MRTLPLIGLCLLWLLAGCIVGRILALHVSVSAEEITVIQTDIREVPVVELTELNSESFVGQMQGDVRVFAAGEMVIPDGSGAFRIPAQHFLTQYVDVLVPDGMRFVASKKGKYYYSVASSNGNNLAPANRVYFRSEEEAQKAGFLPRN